MFFSISLVSAFSVSAPYMENKELILSSDSKITDLEFVLQNGGGATESVNIRVNVLEGSEVINITNEDNIYTVSPGDKIPVNLRITLPEDVETGNIYNVRLEFSTVSAGQSGEFGFGTGQEQSFKVVIAEDLVTSSNFNSIYIYLIIGILLLGLIIFALSIKRKNKDAFKRK